MSISEFIDTCLKLDESDDMKVIVEKKVKKHFNLCNVNYTSSQEFQDFLKDKIVLLEKQPEELFIIIKDVVEELKLRKLKVSTEPPVKKLKVDAGSSQNESAVRETEESKGEEKTKSRQIFLKKLKKLLLILHRKIAKLEEKEVNWDDDNNSDYILLQKYRDRIVAVYKKINEYEGGSTNFNKLNYRKISFTGTPFPKVNASIEKFVNKTGQFPDYRDILQVLQVTCKEENISMTETSLNNMAKAAFQEIGEQLQRKRQFELWNSHSLYLPTEEDPTKGDTDLESKLEENRSKYAGKITEVINKYAEEAENQKLQAEDVPDDGEKSGGEKSEEDDSESTEEEREEDEENNYIENVISDKKKATSSCDEISDNENSDASGVVVLDDDMAAFSPGDGETSNGTKRESDESSDVKLSPVEEETLRDYCGTETNCEDLAQPDKMKVLHETDRSHLSECETGLQEPNTNNSDEDVIVLD